MDNKEIDSKVVYNSDAVVCAIREMGSETSLKDLPLFSTFFIISISLLGLSVLAFISLLFIRFFIPDLANQEILNIIIVAAAICFFLGFATFLIAISLSEKSKEYEKRRNKNATKRRLFLKYFILAFFHENKITVTKQEKQLTSTDIKNRIKKIEKSQNTNCLSINNIDYIIGKISSELKQIENKKNSSFLITLIITLITSGTGLFEKAAKTYAYFVFSSDPELSNDLDLAKKFIESFVDSFGCLISCFIFFVILMIVFSSKSVTGYVVKCRNLEYALSVLNELKTEISNAQAEESSQKLTEISNALISINSSIQAANTTASIEKILTQQNDLFIKISSVLGSIDKKLSVNNKQNNK